MIVTESRVLTAQEHQNVASNQIDFKNNGMDLDISRKDVVNVDDEHRFATIFEMRSNGTKSELIHHYVEA